MSNYRFRIKDYHVIQDADISLEGISVLAGENSSGKSTVLRWLNCVVRILNEYTRIMQWRGTREIARLARKINRAIMAFRVDEPSESALKILRLIDKVTSNSLSYKDSTIMLDHILEEFRHYLLEKELNPTKVNNFDRILSLFDIEKKSITESISLTDLIYNEISNHFEKIKERVKYKTEHFSYDTFGECIPLIIDQTVDVLPISIDLEFEEDGVTLLNENIYTPPVNLTDSIFLKSDEFVSEIDKRTIGKSLLFEQLTSAHEDAEILDDKQLIRKIKKLIDGDVIAEEDDTDFDNDGLSLYYVRKDGLKISLKAAATGIISLSYILRLLKNGWLTKNSVLIIDEPDAHLHPQWIVEYARILVLINKLLGTKIIMATHSPDMVAAIHSIAKKHEVLDKTHFYISEKVNDIHNKYIFKDLGCEIADIFDSFNIALERIDLYGNE